MSAPLDGIRVLDLTRLLPGPFCTLWLADLGAEVIKVEDPGGGDWVRAVPPMVTENDGALFHALNRSKQSIAINLKDERGKDALLRLAKSADVLIEGNRPGVLDRLGVGWEAVHAVNERLVFCAITGYGQTGPFRDRAGHDINYEAIGGTLGITGAADGPPVIPGIPLADHVGAIVAVTAVMGALFERERTGKGQHLDISLTDSAAALMLLHLAPKLAGKADAPARGEVSLTGAQPNYAVYATKDGRYLSVGSLEPRFFTALCTAIERPDLLGDIVGAELDHSLRPALFEKFTGVFASKTLEEWIPIFENSDCCVEPVAEADEILTHPNNQARGLVVEYDHPEVGALSGVRAPLPWNTPPHPAPALGQHTRDVLGAAGYTDSELNDLTDAKVIR